MIKNLIFDIGNVLLSYRWLAMIMEYEPDRDKAKDVGFKMFEAPAWADSFDRGTVDKDGIIELLGKEYPEYKAHYEWILNHPEKMPLPRHCLCLVWKREQLFSVMTRWFFWIRNLWENLKTKQTLLECFSA